MKTPALTNRVSFSRLITLFIKRLEGRFVLPRSIGDGQVQIFQLEKGLQACIWDCSFSEGIEIFNDVSTEIENPYFTLAFFLNTQGLQFSNQNILLKETMVWNCVFISAASNYEVVVDPMARVRCLSISFSKNWFKNNVVESNDEFKNLKDEICVTESFLFFDSMNASEKKLVQELLNISWKKSLGSFYIKSSILKIISDFFYRIKERKTFGLTGASCDTITMVENYLNSHLTETLPNLKDLACRFSISESTLNRHFKMRYGMNISTYFTGKKMDYARKLIQNENMNPTETALALGYKNVHHFIRVYKKIIQSSNT